MERRIDAVQEDRPTDRPKQQQNEPISGGAEEAVESTCQQRHEQPNVIVMILKLHFSIALCFG